MSIPSLTMIEELKMKAGKLTVNEAFTVCSKLGYMSFAIVFVLVKEAGPQLLLQLHIISCTGNLGSVSQKISIVVSILSLTYGACRAFFIQRDQRRADSAPTLHMIIR